jgi:hypothetical protein
MKNLLVICLIFTLLSCGSDVRTDSSLQSEDQPENRTSSLTMQSTSSLYHNEQGGYKKGEILVKFKSGLVPGMSVRTHEARGGSIIRRFSLMPGLEHIKLSEGISVTDAVAEYLADPNVEYAEPNYIRRTSMTVPNDPLFSQQWSLHNTIVSGADIDITGAWDIHTGSGRTVIAFLDTGIDYNHPDLVDNIWTNSDEVPGNGIDDDDNGFIDDWRGWNFVRCAQFHFDGTCVVSKTQDNDPMDDSGHGTHVAGIVGAMGSNAIGIAGIIWDVQLMPLKILDATGSGTITDEIEAIQYAISKNAQVINMSFNGPSFSHAEFDALDAAKNDGVLVIAAAGNGGGDNIGDSNDLIPQYPASYNLPNIISVAATNSNDGIASFSNFGLNSVSVAAPGVAILSTFPTSFDPTGYISMTGTSMSAAHVSGLTGLLRDFYPDFSFSQIRGIVLRYVDVLTSLQGLVLTNGRINVHKALSCLLAPSDLSFAIRGSNALISSQAMSRIDVSWSDNATGEDGYSVDRKTSGDPYSRIATVDADTQGYSDGTALEGNSYMYRIRAFSSLPDPPNVQNLIAESSALEKSLTVPLNPPTGLQASPVSSVQINLAWMDNSSAEKGYDIERALAGGMFQQIAMTGPDSTTFSDSGLTPASQYRYRVRAFNAPAGDSLYSNEVVATTPPETGETVDAGGGGGGGGCSIQRNEQAKNSSIGSIFMVFIPLIVFAVLRRRI